LGDCLLWALFGNYQSSHIFGQLFSHGKSNAIILCKKWDGQMVYFQTKNPNLGKFFKSLPMEDVGIF
jgi:hypothetical protein